jgi:hypothetical protein
MIAFLNANIEEEDWFHRLSMAFQLLQDQGLEVVSRLDLPLNDLYNVELKLIKLLVQCDTIISMPGWDEGDISVALDDIARFAKIEKNLYTDCIRTVKLKSCPMCGCEPRADRLGSSFKETTTVIRCDCGLTMETSEQDEECGMAWNSRVYED